VALLRDIRTLTRAGAALAVIISWVVTASPAVAQTPAVAPAPGFVLHDQQPVERFIVQRWVNTASPGVSPAGFCECITLVYEGRRLLLNSGAVAGITKVSTFVDVTGDRRPELMIRTNSGGAHCCESIALYSVDGVRPTRLLSLNTGDCMGKMADLDKDGVAEYQTCDPAYSYAFCPFAFSPLPPAVYAYNKTRGMFVLATPRYARYLRLATAGEARKTMAENPNNREIARCAALGPALGQIYTGRVAQGRRLFRQLYRGPDAAAVEEKAIAIAMKSTMWVAR